MGYTSSCRQQKEWFVAAYIRELSNKSYKRRRRLRVGGVGVVVDSYLLTDVSLMQLVAELQKLKSASKPGTSVEVSSRASCHEARCNPLSDSTIVSVLCVRLCTFTSRSVNRVMTFGNPRQKSGSRRGTGSDSDKSISVRRCRDPALL